MESAIKVTDVTKTYMLGETQVFALKGVSLEVKKRDFMVLAGTSGSGKTTLLNLIGCLDRPTSGSIFIESRNTMFLSESEKNQFRCKNIGFIFQTFNLFPVLNALENVEYPLLLLDQPKHKRLQVAREALIRVGLGEQIHHRPSQMSGGQRQRVAIARAIVKGPQIILADEPTANLDQNTATEIINLLKNLNEQDGTTFVISTHDQSIISRAKTVFSISDGRECSHAV